MGKTAKLQTSEKSTELTECCGRWPTLYDKHVMTVTVPGLLQRRLVEKQSESSNAVRCRRGLTAGNQSRYKKVKSFPEPQGPIGGTDLRFLSPQPDTSRSRKIRG